jgi:hypothetical protein
MHIQEIIIDGFKSYAHRTTIEGYVMPAILPLVSMNFILDCGLIFALVLLSPDLIPISMPLPV